MRVVDLTAELYTGLPVYPGDPPVAIAPAATVAADGYAVARLALSDQAGTHVETQAHFLAGGRTLDDQPLERFVGRASVVDVPCRALGTADLAPAETLIRRNPFLLLRSGYADLGRPIDPRDPERPALALEALR